MASSKLRYRIVARARLLRRMILVAVALIGTWLMAFIICPQCAYEQPKDANFCAHCGANLRPAASQPARPDTAPADQTQENVPAATAPGVPAPTIATPAPAGTAAAPGDRMEAMLSLVSQSVLADVTLAREMVAQGRPEVARAIYANALAVSIVAPAALTPVQGEQILREMQAVDERVLQAGAPCPSCDGTGKRAMRLEALAGEATSITAAGMNCPTCNGTGNVRRTRSIDDLKYVLGQAWQQAELALRSRGRVPVGRAWVPAELANLLDTPLEARLRHAAAAPCAACQGLGRTDCRTCTNTGFVTCRAKGCENGWIEREDTNRVGLVAALKRREPCPECGATGRIACQNCQGAGGVSCRSCNGSGKRPICNACGGDGTASCRGCRGSGKLRDGTACGECGGDGLTLCRTCRGDGYRSR